MSKRTAGFTLAETVVLMTVVALVSASLTKGVQFFVRNQREHSAISMRENFKNVFNVRLARSDIGRILSASRSVNLNFDQCLAGTCSAEAQGTGESISLFDIGNPPIKLVGSKSAPTRLSLQGEREPCVGALAASTNCPIEAYGMFRVAGGKVYAWVEIQQRVKVKGLSTLADETSKSEERSIPIDRVRSQCPPGQLMSGYSPDGYVQCHPMSCKPGEILERINESDQTAICRSLQACQDDWFIKGLNNGTVSCDTFCAGSQWGTEGTCLSAWRDDNGASVPCGTATGFLNGAMLVCQCKPLQNFNAVSGGLAAMGGGVGHRCVRVLKQCWDSEVMVGMSGSGPICQDKKTKDSPLCGKDEVVSEITSKGSVVCRKALPDRPPVVLGSKDQRPEGSKECPPGYFMAGLSKEMNLLCSQYPPVWIMNNVFYCSGSDSNLPDGYRCFGMNTTCTDMDPLHKPCDNEGNTCVVVEDNRSVMILPRPTEGLDTIKGKIRSDQMQKGGSEQFVDGISGGGYQRQCSSKWVKNEEGNWHEETVCNDVPQPVFTYSHSADMHELYGFKGSGQLGFLTKRVKLYRCTRPMRD